MGVSSDTPPFAHPHRWQSQFGGRSVLVTGHTGFKGAWLSRWLRRLGAQVSGFSLPPDDDQLPLFAMVESDDTFENSLFGDIRQQLEVDHAFEVVQPDVVLHLAAQPLVRLSYEVPVDTFAVNVLGTATVLDAVRRFETPTSVFVTSDKCYENFEQPWPFVETDRMGGHDAYSASKGAAELVIASYRRSFLSQAGLGCASARAGNVVGGGDLSRDRLLPDLLRAMRDSAPFEVRNPSATRPWQHVVESLSGYLTLATALAGDPHSFSGGWNFGPDPMEQVSVGEFVDVITAALGDRSPQIASGRPGPHEAQLLSLDITKSRECLGWQPLLTTGQRAGMTAAWFKADLEGQLSIELLDSQLATFESIAESQ